MLVTSGRDISNSNAMGNYCAYAEKYFPGQGRVKVQDSQLLVIPSYEQRCLIGSSKLNSYQNCS